MDNKTVINLSDSNTKEPVTVYLLEGTLPEPINLSAQNYTGNIHAVSEYIQRSNFNALDSIIIINDDGKTIELTVTPNHPHKIVVRGALKKTLVFEKFQIETSGRFSTKEFAQLVRTHKMYFPDTEVHSKLLMSLKNVEVAFQQNAKELDDDRGNTTSLFQTKIESNMLERFTLEVPIFKGLDPVTFEVNICLERRDKGMSLWLESAEALELMESSWQTLLAEKMKVFKEKKITVIQV